MMQLFIQLKIYHCRLLAYLFIIFAIQNDFEKVGSNFEW